MSDSRQRSGLWVAREGSRTGLKTRAAAIRHQYALVALALVSTVALAACQTKPIREKQINVVFRFDDYSARSFTEIEQRIIDAFGNIESPVTFAVIPFVCDGDAHDPSPQAVVPLASMKETILKRGLRDGVLDIALHGYSHQTINAERMTEFAGRDYESQVQRLSEGKEFLEQIIGAPVTTFVPPWNSYDVYTVRALEQVGFGSLSADRTGEAPGSSKLSFLPGTCELYQLRDAVQAAKSSFDTQSVIVVVFHEYDFKEIDEELGHTTYPEFLDLLHWVKSQPDVRLVSISEAVRAIENLTADRLMVNRRNLQLALLLPSPLRDKELTTTYQESRGWPARTALKLKVKGFYLTVFALAAVIFFVTGMFLFQRSAFMIKIGTFGSAAASMVIVSYAFHDLRVHMRGMIVSAVAVGASAGLWAAFLYLRKRELRDRTGEKQQS